MRSWDIRRRIGLLLLLPVLLAAPVLIACGETVTETVIQTVVV